LAPKLKTIIAEIRWYIMRDRKKRHRKSYEKWSGETQ